MWSSIITRDELSHLGLTLGEPCKRVSRRGIYLPRKERSGPQIEVDSKCLYSFSRVCSTDQSAWTIHDHSIRPPVQRKVQSLIECQRQSYCKSFLQSTFLCKEHKQPQRQKSRQMPFKACNFCLSSSLRKFAPSIFSVLKPRSLTSRPIGSICRPSGRSSRPIPSLVPSPRCWRLGGRGFDQGPSPARTRECTGKPGIEALHTY